MSWERFAPYVSVAERQKQAEREATRRAKSGDVLLPVRPAGRKVATTFWGKAWCDHLESHSDYSNRLPRGMTYVRNGSVIDLKVQPGRVAALVSGSAVYSVRVDIDALPGDRWRAIAQSCAGRIDSLVELLQGRLDKGVLTRLCDRTDGLFPRPRQMKFACSCPDGASVCKHVAATLYGVGHRLDTQPELLFLLRQVDQQELVRHAAVAPVATVRATANALEDDSLADLFGLELDDAGPPVVTRPVSSPVVEFVSGVLAGSPELEFSLADLFDEQPAKPRHTRKAVIGALAQLVAERRAVVSVDEDGTEYWAVAR